MTQCLSKICFKRYNVTIIFHLKNIDYSSGRDSVFFAGFVTHPAAIKRLMKEFPRGTSTITDRRDNNVQPVNLNRYTSHATMCGIRPTAPTTLTTALFPALHGLSSQHSYSRNDYRVRIVHLRWITLSFPIHGMKGWTIKKCLSFTLLDKNNT